SLCSPARWGSPSAARTAAGSDTARATTSRTNFCDLSAAKASRQSATNWNRSNMGVPPFELSSAFSTVETNVGVANDRPPRRSLGVKIARQLRGRRADRDRAEVLQQL